jgi:predicted phosphodiesterase
VSIAVISDLHLGARASTDLFGHDDSEFLKFLRFLENNFQRVVLLGDVWETLTTPLPRGHAKELELARERHRELAAFFRRPRFTYVHGNHDLVAGNVDGAPSEVRLESGGVRFLFAHGHQSDRLVMRARPISELGVCLGGWIRRAGLSAAYKLFSRLDEMRSLHEASERVSPVEQWAVAHATSTEADVVVTGHTHHARRAEHGARLYLNSGSCSEGKISFLSLDPARGRYEVHTSY